MDRGRIVIHDNFDDPIPDFDFSGHVEDELLKPDAE